MTVPLSLSLIIRLNEHTRPSTFIRFQLQRFTLQARLSGAGMRHGMFEEQTYF